MKPTALFNIYLFFSPCLTYHPYLFRDPRGDYHHHGVYGYGLQIRMELYRVRQLRENGQGFPDLANMEGR